MHEGSVNPQQRRRDTRRRMSGATRAMCAKTVIKVQHTFAIVDNISVSKFVHRLNTDASL